MATSTRSGLFGAALLALLATAPARAADSEPPREADAWMNEAYRLRAAGDGAGAERALESARSAGFDPQRVAIELAYVAAARGDASVARTRFSEAARGGDPEVAARARAELVALEPPPPVRLELYAETFGWRRLSGPSATDDAVPMVRLRALRRPWPDVPLEVYAVAQATRDVRSRPGTATAGPVILADDAALAGGGVLVRSRVAGAFAQVAAATSLLGDGASPGLDARAGVWLGLERAGCAPAAGGVRLLLVPCAELWSEATWLSRFDHDVVGLVRGRAGASWLVTGPVAWQLVVEARAGADRNLHWWDDFADAGAGHRWRLLRPFRLDLLLSAHAGRYLGASGPDPVPADPGYADVRLELAMEIDR